MFTIAECYTLGPRCALSVLGATLGPGSESRQSPVGPLLNTNTENISEQKIFQNRKYFKTKNLSRSHLLSKELKEYEEHLQLLRTFCLG